MLSRGFKQKIMRIAFHFSGWVLVSLLLVGCINREPEERASFISWLQGQLIDAPDARVPVLDAAQHKALGDYVEQYQLLIDFQALTHAQMTQLAKTFEDERLDAVAQLQARRDILKADFQALVAGRAAMQQAQARALVVRADWKQPVDLQPVYSRAYDKVVTIPASVLSELTATALAALDDALQVSDFLSEHSDQVTIQDDSAAVRDPSVQRQINQKLEALNSHATAVAHAQARLRMMQTQ